MKTRHTLLLLLLALPLAALAAGQATGDSHIYLPLIRRPAPPSTTLVSVASDGTPANANSRSAVLSDDGRFVAFVSDATNLVHGDSNAECYSDPWGQWFHNCPDVFVHDRQSGQTTRVSVATDATQGNAASGDPSISADGLLIAFQSEASNLVDGDTNSGTYCSTYSLHGNCSDVFVHDRQTGETVLVSVASDGTSPDNASGAPSISAGGRFVAFSSWATNLVPGDTNNTGDVFVYDRLTRETTRVSVASNGTEGNGPSDRPSLSADGRFVAFDSQADNLVAGDTSLMPGVFVHDTQTGETVRVSVASEGAQADDWAMASAISANGRVVAFASWATNLVPGDTNNVCGDVPIYNCSDVFVHDRLTTETTRVSVASDSSEGNGHSHNPSLSADGRFVAFDSGANNLVTGDSNGLLDIFVHDRQTGATTLVSVSTDGLQSNERSYAPYITPNGRFVAFESLANNLVPWDTNDYITDIFVRDRGE